MAAVAELGCCVCETESVPMEIWKDVPGFGGHYQASSHGRVRSKARTITKRTRWGGVMTQEYPEKVLSKIRRDKYGHLGVHIGNGGVKYTVFIHHMVLLAFVGPRPDGMECCHNNGIANDNRPENLRWDSHKNNNGDRVVHGTYQYGEDHHMAKFSNAKVREVCEYLRSGGRGRDAARIFGISESHASRIRRGRHGALAGMVEA